jgi:exonuclease SbcD
VRAVQILHMADMHLDWPFAGLGERAKPRRAELRDRFVQIIDLAITHHVEVMLIAGDLFEHQHVGTGTIQFLAAQFRRIPQVQIFLSPGNHDPYLPTSYYATYPWPENLHIFGPEIDRVDLPDLPVSVYGWGFGAWEVPHYQLGGLRIGDSDRINLLVTHGGDPFYHPFKPSDLEAIGADYAALGHIHKPGVVLQQGGRVIAQYSGSPEALGFGEPGDHGVLVGSISKNETRLSFHSTAYRRCVSVEIDLSGVETTDQISQLLLRVEEADRRRHAYRITLTGEIDSALALDLSLLQSRLVPHFYFLKLIDRTRPAYDLGRIAAERSARGLFVQRLLAMEGEEQDEAGQLRIRRALALGLSAFEGVKR